MGPVQLLVVRHGESMGNVAAAAANYAAAEVIEVGQRDADVPLSPTGVIQAQALGSWLRDLPDEIAPDAVWVSPYQRAYQTAQIAIQGSGRELPMTVDERIRDRELGVLDLLTTIGVANRFPQEAARRQWLGKFYHRPPGGESWADVVLRVRSFLRDLETEAPGRRVLVVAHDALVLIFRYVCEHLSEQEILAIALTNPVANASATRLVRPSGEGRWELETYNLSAHVEAYGAPVTVHPGDAEILPRNPA